MNCWMSLVQLSYTWIAGIFKSTETHLYPQSKPPRNCFAGFFLSPNNSLSNRVCHPARWLTRRQLPPGPFKPRSEESKLWVANDCTSLLPWFSNRRFIPQNFALLVSRHNSNQSFCFTKGGIFDLMINSSDGQNQATDFICFAAIKWSVSPSIKANYRF